MQEKIIMPHISKKIMQKLLFSGNIILFSTHSLIAAELLRPASCDCLHSSPTSKSESTSMTPGKRRSLQKQTRIYRPNLIPNTNSVITTPFPNIPEERAIKDLPLSSHRLSHDGTRSHEDSKEDLSPSAVKLTKFLEEEMRRPLFLQFSKESAYHERTADNLKEIGIQNKEFYPLYSETYHLIRSHALKYSSFCSKSKLRKLNEFLAQLKVFVDNKLLLRLNNEELYKSLAKIKEEYSLYVYLNDDTIDETYKKNQILDVMQSFLKGRNNCNNPYNTVQDHQCKALDIIVIELNDYVFAITDKMPKLADVSSMLVNCTFHTAQLFEIFFRNYKNFLNEIGSERRSLLNILDHFWRLQKDHMSTKNQKSLLQLLSDLSVLENKIKFQETIKALEEASSLETSEVSLKKLEKKSSPRHHKSSPELKTGSQSSSFFSKVQRSKSGTASSTRIKEHHSNSLTDSEISEKPARKSSGNSQLLPRSFKKKESSGNNDKI